MTTEDKIIEVTNIHKKKLMNEINNIIDNNGWTNKEAAYYMNVNISGISTVRNHYYNMISINNLIKYLIRLDHNISFDIIPLD